MKHLAVARSPAAPGGLAVDLAAPDERRLLAALLAPDTTIEVAIPDSAEPDRLWELLRVCAHAHTQLQQSMAKMKPLIGRVLVVMRNRPETWQERGYKTFDDFLTRGMEEQFGISRAESYHALRIALALPDLDLSQAGRIGLHKLSAVVPLVRENPDRREEVLTFAEHHSLDRVREYVVRKGAFEPGDLEMKVLALSVSRSVKERFLALLKDPDVCAFVGSASPSALIEAMLDEVEIEWRGNQHATMGHATTLVLVVSEELKERWQRFVDHPATRGYTGAEDAAQVLDAMLEQLEPEWRGSQRIQQPEDLLAEAGTLVRRAAADLSTALDAQPQGLREAHRQRVATAHAALSQALTALNGGVPAQQVG